MEQITHAVQEHSARLSPSIRKAQSGRMQGYAEAGPGGAEVTVLLMLRVPHGFESPRERERVAVVTAGRNAVASRGGIPCGFRPLDRALVGHKVGV